MSNSFGGNTEKETIWFDMNDIPYPTAIYIHSTEELIFNDRAAHLLGIDLKEHSDLTRWKEMNVRLMDVIVMHKDDTVVDQKVHVVLNNGKQELMNYSLSHITTSLYGEVFLILFSLLSEKASVNLTASLSEIKEEVSRLKPFLDHTGKIVLRTLMKEYFGVDNPQYVLDDLVSYEVDLHAIMDYYPALSYREAVICCLLKNEYDISDIAIIIFRTPQSVYGAIHRINKKLGFLNRKELVATLRQIGSVNRTP